MIPRPQPTRFLRAATCAGLALTWLVAGSGERCARAAQPDSIRWRADYASALEEAKTADRLLWIQFTGPWCPNCTRMERDSFPAPPVVQHAEESFIPVKLRTDIYEQLALSFNLSAIPASIVVAPSREVVAVQQGYLGPAELDGFLKEARARSGLGRAKAGTSVSQNSRKEEQRHGAGERKRPADLPLALLGYCPVSLVRDRKLVLGQAGFTVEREGRIYRFGERAMAEEFRKQPDRFMPRNDGACPVSEVDLGTKLAGSPKWGVIYQDRLFLCASAEARQQFASSPERYAAVDVAEQGFCPHCIRASGLLVRGDPRHELAHDGRRYWFPDRSHRDAFLACTR
ncbi:MAG: thioredoxin family protein [Isosphaeraceae bacterium]